MACLFCDIVSGAIPATVVYSGANVTAFRDINPQAPTHILIIPNRHIAAIADVTEDDRDLLGEMVAVANQLAKEEGVAESGYRFVINNGAEGGQTVQHLHLHLLGGRQMKWPPG